MHVLLAHIVLSIESFVAWEDLGVGWDAFRAHRQLIECCGLDWSDVLTGLEAHSIHAAIRYGANITYLHS